MAALGIGLSEAVVRYADRFHAALGTGHHVASPLGAWLLLAFAARAASGDSRAELAQVLGDDVDDAAAWADALLSKPHPLVSVAAAAWQRDVPPIPELADWLARLPPAVETGPIPAPQDLDAWVRQHTRGLIDRYPFTVGPTLALLLASALATRVSWEVPFTVAPASELGSASRWAGQLTTVLRTPHDPRHLQFIAASARCGDVAVHSARARGGLLVASVIAAPEVPAPEVIGAAHRIAIGLVDGAPSGARSLFDLPLGAGPAWTVTEQAAETTVADGREERYVTCLPAWSARSQHDLGRAELGCPAVAAVLAGVLGPGMRDFVVRQAVMARYTRVGFEAAAVTGLAMTSSRPHSRAGLRREARLRFAHPYAVVAVAANDTDETRDPWHGLPVFSAWVAEPDDAGELPD